ncbi:hypothetical protein CC86DRAFT_33816 [Ophiobolus disseminans]|uniref:Uncharacterized protein n=1 Tax=Ophiobolus disseminans TaxID=1469910 RepID=A0A6A6ZXS6_9PLEO|nr:hypothetical protein CC86DRAFT_33816 [Ophiobolus disseminans]
MRALRAPRPSCAIVHTCLVPESRLAIRKETREAAATSRCRVGALITAGCPRRSPVALSPFGTKVNSALLGREATSQAWRPTTVKTPLNATTARQVKSEDQLGS